MREDLLAKWLDKSITSEELRVLEKEYDLNTLKSVLKKIDTYQPAANNPELMYADFRNKIGQPQQINKASHSKKWYLLVALIFFVGLAIVLRNLLNNKNLIIKSTIPSQTIEFVLKDSTKIQLGPGSTLSYDEATVGENREFQLTGQAYFDVPTPGPLVVHTTFGKVEVLGTRFLIEESVKDHSIIECYEGSVRVLHKASLKTKTIKAGESLKASYKALEAVEKITKVNPSWLEGYAQYKDTPLSTAFKDLELYYGVQFQTSPSIDLTTLINARIPVNNIDLCLQYLTNITKLNYEVTDNGVVQVK